MRIYRHVTDEISRLSFVKRRLISVGYVSFSLRDLCAGQPMTLARAAHHSRPQAYVRTSLRLRTRVRRPVDVRTKA